MIIRIEIRNVYGEERYYPANETAEIFAKIAGTKTLKRETLAQAKKLGASIEVMTALEPVF